jgi:hypothetical protein
VPLYDLIVSSNPGEPVGDRIALDIEEIAQPTVWPAYGIVRATTFDQSLVGRRAEVRPSHSGSREIDANPYVSVAVEAYAGRWRGVGHGKLHRIKGPPFDDGGAWIDRVDRTQG